jgi:inner membrane protein
MDNVCHTLVGAAVGEAGLKTRTRFGAAALMISANLPDLDVLIFATDTPHVSFRRGWTHGAGAQLLLPVLLTGVLWLVGRRRSGPPGGPGVHAGWLLVLSYTGVYTHVFLDYLNNYGVRLLVPLDWRWFYGDALFIVDPWLWLVLGVGVWAARRWASPRPARWSLATATCYILMMLAVARSARVAAIEQWEALRGVRPRAVMAGPLPVTPFGREVIVDAGDHYERGRWSWPSTVVFSPEAILKNDASLEVRVAREAPDVRAFLVWSRFPFWSLEPAGEGTRVTVTDARFMALGRMFSASTVVTSPRVNDVTGGGATGQRGRGERGRQEIFR